MTEKAAKASALRERLRILASQKRTQRALAVALMIGIFTALLGTSMVLVTVEMKTTTGAGGELFYAMEGQEYSAGRRVGFAVTPDDQWHSYDIELPNVQELARLRVDPAPAIGSLAIRRLALSTQSSRVLLKSGDLHAAVDTTHGMEAISDELDAPLRYRSTADDPHVDFILPPSARTLSLPGTGLILKAIGMGLLAALGWIAIELVASLVASWLRAGRVHKLLTSVAQRISDDNVLRVSPAIVAVLAAVGLASALYVALDLNQSSIGFWEEIHPARPVHQSVELGTARWIRMDEWKVYTPWVFNQVLKGAPQVNFNLGGEASPLLVSVPVKHPIALLQFKFYGFHLFDLETGFSWFWAYKSFATFLSFLWLLLILTRADLGVSTFGATWLYASSYMQWWFSSGVTEIISAAMFAVIAAHYLLFARRHRGIALGAVVLAYSIVNLATQVYPPLLVCLGYLGALIVLGVLVEPGRLAQVRENLGWRAGAFALSALLMTALLGNYASDAWSTIAAMQDTTYPGHRVSVSGEEHLASTMSAFFEPYRSGESLFPFVGRTNACEASSFLLLAPVVAIALPLQLYLSRAFAVLGSLGVYFALTLAWANFHLPMLVERAMQKGGWSLAPPARVIAGIGIASILFVCVLFAHVRRGALTPSLGARVGIPLLLAAALLVCGYDLHLEDPSFFSWKTIIAGTVAACAITAGVLSGHFLPALVGLGLTTLPAMTANPLISGVTSLTEKPVLLQAKRLGGGALDKWAVLGNAEFAQGLKAHGLNVINGVNYVPNKEVSSVFDARGEYAHVWNRYAHVVMTSDPARPSPYFQLSMMDTYGIWLNVCGPELRKLNVSHLAYAGVGAPAADLSCLERLEAPADSGVELYRLKASTTSPSIFGDRMEGLAARLRGR